MGFMPPPSTQRHAKIAVSILFLALIRTIGEFYRLRYLRGQALDIASVTPFIDGSLISALGVWAAVTCYFYGRFRAAMVVVVGTIVLMLGYKLLFMA